MIKYFYMYLFYSKKRLILILGLIIWIGLMMAIVYPNESIPNQRLYRIQNQVYYEMMINQLLIFLFPFFIVLLVMDHDQDHIKPMMSYFSKTRIAVYKIIFYVIILTWLYSIFFMIYHVLPSLLTAYYAYDDSSIIFFLNLYLDGLMVSMFVFIFIRDKHKALSILIALFYVLANFMIEDSPNTLLFYLFPQFSSYFSQITLAYPYKICYICLGLTINLIQINYETL
mgnify:CR=1 FL=1